MGDVKLTGEQVIYQDNCYSMFVGQMICSVVYGELQYFLDKEGTSIDFQPYYKTKYSDVDTIDYSIYFKTESKTIHVFWDNTFFCYGLLSRLIEMTEKTNNYEQKWEVSNDEKWLSVIGQKITNFKILWDTWTDINKIQRNNPQTFILELQNGIKILLSACELQENESKPASDNLLVTTNIELAKQLKII